MTELAIHPLYYWIAGLFAFASTLLCLYSVGNVMRLRNVRLSWSAGTILGYPLFASLFLLAMALVTGLSLLRQESMVYSLLAGYSWVGVAWFLSSYLASKKYITDHGIVKNINEPSQTVAWHQIVDYVHHSEEQSPAISTKSEYTFFFRETDNRGKLIGPVFRLELSVPKAKLEPFQAILALKLLEKKVRYEEIQELQNTK